jgi:DNA-binding transcriptional ArsR family regulator
MALRFFGLRYNIFVDMNITQNTEKEFRNIAHILSLLGQPNRLRIALALGEHEACVCHLEACLGVRQATISQHLMALRDAGLVEANRDGRNIYYRLSQPGILNLILQAGSLSHTDFIDIKNASKMKIKNCPCPHCNPEGTNCS